MRYTLLIIILLASTGADAAELRSYGKAGGAWVFEYDIKSRGALVSTPLTTGVYDCKPPSLRAEAYVRKPTVCAKDEAEAKQMAQKQAEDFEKSLDKQGMSTTTIEAKRLTMKATGK